MGQFLCIGLRTALTVERKGLNQPCMTPEEVQAELERQLVPAHLYERFESDEKLVYCLRNDAVQDEFLAFLREFYRIRYDEVGEKAQNSDFYMERISEYHNLAGWVKLAEEKCMEGFQIAGNYSNLRIKEWRHLEYHERDIILSLTGKVWMECYGDLFRFMLNCIKSRLSQFEMKDTLSIFLTN